MAQPWPKRRHWRATACASVARRRRSPSWRSRCWAAPPNRRPVRPSRSSAVPPDSRFRNQPGRILARAVYEHVLAVTDGSRKADHAVAAAGELAFEHRARLTVATVVELEPPGRRCGPARGVWNDVLRDAARADLDRAGRLVRIPADFEIFYGK